MEERIDTYLLQWMQEVGKELRSADSSLSLLLSSSAKTEACYTAKHNTYILVFAQQMNCLHEDKAIWRCVTAFTCCYLLIID
jgi:hypothetical protein